MKLREITPWNWFKREAGDHSRMPGHFYGSEDPFQRMARMHQEMDRMFDQMLGNFGMSGMREEGAEGSRMPARYLQPKVDIRELADRYEVNAELPGVDDKDLHLDLAGDTLVIKAEKRDETSKDEGEFHRRECYFGSFQRMLTLPENANREQVEATFKNGILTVKLPKTAKPATEHRHIDIKH